MGDDADIAAAARAQAEARRKRILEKGVSRMGKVSGELGQDASEKKQVASNAARIRAARARRYGKKSTSTAAPTPTANEKPVESNEEPKVTEAPPPTESTVKEAVNPESVEPKVEQASGEEEKKKYLGVAKMRRRMIAKKKAEEAAEKPTAEEEPIPSTPKSTPDVALPTKTKKPVSKFPIYMHIVTILLLFFAGVDVGLQQYHEDVQIHDQFAYKEHGIPLWNGKLKGDSGFKTIPTESSLGDTEEDIFHDEFDTMDEDLKPAGNIDPLFGVDLDDLTKGPGILNQLARGAVSIHRLILQLFYFIPKSIIMSLISIPQALLETPPALCLVALGLRQIVGKRILGAGIPSVEDDEKDSGFDLAVMAKKYMTSFISSTFPTSVVVFDAFSYLRSDMYIIMCGVFCGLAWTHMSSDKAVIVDVGSDEL